MHIDIYLIYSYLKINYFNTKSKSNKISRRSDKALLINSGDMHLLINSSDAQTKWKLYS